KSSGDGFRELQHWAEGSESERRPPDGDCSKNVNCILGASPTLQSYRLPGFNASIASGGTVTCSECGRPCQGKSSEGSPPAFPMFWPPYIPESLFNSSA